MDVYASISDSSWNQNEMRALNTKQESSLPAAFGNFELIVSTATSNFLKSNNLDRAHL
jgi:hypothetical protein